MQTCSDDVAWRFTHLVRFVATLATVGFAVVMDAHVFLQLGCSVQDLTALRTLVQVFGVNLLNVLSKLLQTTEAHATLLTVVWVRDIFQGEMGLRSGSGLKKSLGLKYLLYMLEIIDTACVCVLTVEGLQVY